MNNNILDRLIQKYLKGETTRNEERQLLDVLLKSFNDILEDVEFYKKLRKEFITY